MSQVVLGQMGHLGPGTDNALTDHVENNLGCRSLVVLDCTKENSRCPGCPELSLGLLWHMMAIPDNPPYVVAFYTHTHDIPHPQAKGR